MDTALTMPSIMSGSLIRATPPSLRMSAGTRSRAITATAPASSAILAWAGGATSLITPPLRLSAMPRVTRAVPTAGACALFSFTDTGTSQGEGLADERTAPGDHPRGRASVIHLTMWPGQGTGVDGEAACGRWAGSD